MRAFQRRVWGLPALIACSPVFFARTALGLFLNQGFFDTLNKVSNSITLGWSVGERTKFFPKLNKLNTVRRSLGEEGFATP
jgi:hypothetical protein